MEQLCIRTSLIKLVILGETFKDSPKLGGKWENILLNRLLTINEIAYYWSITTYMKFNLQVNLRFVCIFKNNLIYIFSRIGYSIPMFVGFIIMFLSTLSKCIFCVYVLLKPVVPLFIFSFWGGLDISLHHSQAELIWLLDDYG